MTEYGFALAAMMALTLLSRRWEIMLSGLVVVASWAAWCIFILATGDYEPWYAGIVVDGVAIAVLLRAPSCKTRAVISALFAAQVAAHIAYGIVLWWAGDADWQAYYTQTQVAGWAQLLIVGGWGGGVAWRRIVDRGRRHHLLGHRAHSRDMGAGQ